MFHGGNDYDRLKTAQDRRGSGSNTHESRGHAEVYSDGEQVGHISTPVNLAHVKGGWARQDSMTETAA